MDNVDDSNILTANSRGTQIPLIARLPQTKGAVLLTTTRDDHIARSIAGDRAKPFAVLPMSAEDAALLHEQKLPDPELRSSASQQDTLLSTLGYLPLAIVQAAAYMLQYRVTVEQYLGFREQVRTCWSLKRRPGIS